ncbi:MAG: sugar phosphate isomerase/epimerase [Chloroflexi bacterium]|nr:sugar phosphate isomerase/epimerase [Chloroflexota bacterium]MCL5273989.1 sugar phosphate isomerase/epimerase [Chloroflexota bacterium]
MSAIPIGLQLYSVREDCASYLPAALKAIAAMGYAGVEFAGYYGYRAQALRSLLDAYGLKCCGTHTSLASLLGEQLPATIEFNQTLGNKYLIVPSLPEQYRNSSAAWLETAALFNRIAEQLAPHGMLTGYHNHFIEFQPIAGGAPFDLFFSHTSPAVVMQIDLGNAIHGGGDPIACLRNYPGRAVTVHLKEYAAGYDKALIGEGDVKWAEVFSLCENGGGAEWYIVEQESYAYPPMECVKRCLDNLRKMGK